MWPHDTRSAETCDECRFDGAAYTNADVAGTLRNLAGWAGSLVIDIDTDVLGTRPAPHVWSPAEYLRHIKRMLWSMNALADLALDDRGHAVEGSPPTDAAADDPPVVIDIGRELLRLHQEAIGLHDRWVGADAGARRRTVTVNGRAVDLGDIVRHATHDATHHLSDIGRGVAALGVGTPPATGRIERIGASGGGVPKVELDEADIGYRGIDGDRQKVRRHHGRVWQALCLWSAEVIEALAAEGHPVRPGSAGENLTIAGLDWAALRPGTRLLLGGTGEDGDSGSGVLIECTTWTEPCRTIAGSFQGRDFRRIDAVRHPGSSRIYAKVLTDGTVRRGDAVSVV